MDVANAIALAVLVLGAVALIFRDRISDSLGVSSNTGTVFIEDGKIYRPVKCRKLQDAALGETWKYKYNGKEVLMVVPANYPVKYIRRRRVFGCLAGALVASPMGSKVTLTDGDMVRVPLGQSDGVPVPNPVVSALVLKHVAVDLVNAVSGKADSMSKLIKWALIGLLVVAVVWFCYQNGVFASLGIGADPSAIAPNTPPPVTGIVGPDGVK